MSSFPVVIYRVGGTANFEWRKSLAYESMERATLSLQGVRRQGYAAFIGSTESELPTTFELPPEQRPTEPLANTCPYCLGRYGLQWGGCEFNCRIHRLHVNLMRAAVANERDGLIEPEPAEAPRCIYCGGPNTRESESEYCSTQCAAVAASE